MRRTAALSTVLIVSATALPNAFAAASQTQPLSDQPPGSTAPVPADAGSPVVLATFTSSFLSPTAVIQLLNVMPNSRTVPVTPGYQLQLYWIKPGPKRPVTGLSELRGLVRIDSRRKALDFVRLRTSLHVGIFFDPEPFHEWEILTLAQCRALSSYGTRDYLGYGPSESGDFGALSEEAYRAGGFQPPVVRPLPHHGGYRIVRWTFDWVYLRPTPPGEERQDYARRYVVRKIEETVSMDGAYSNRVLLEKDAPDLPGTNWHPFMVYM